MEWLGRLFRRSVSFKPQPADLKMWKASRSSGIASNCECLAPQYGNRRYGRLVLHPEVQNTQCDGWKALLELIDSAVSKQSQEFAPGLEMSPELWSQVITLPASISKLTAVRKLYLYGSHLVRLPPEIGDMVNLEELDLYTSYRLHYAPFEVTRCSRLKRSRVSTRALYGNYKHRPPFPRLDIPESKVHLPSNCSVCRNPLPPEGVQQAWITLLIATDVLPLLVNACSLECIQRLPASAYGYVDHPHAGGLDVKQPPAGMIPPSPNRKWKLD
jgi:hypothetical protein